MHVGEGSREQPTVLIVHLDFRLQRARPRVERTRDVRHLAVKLLAGILREVQLRHRPYFHIGRIRLRHVHVHAQDVRPRHAEKLLPAVRCVDQRAHVGVALGDDACERRDEQLEILLHRQVLDVGLIGLHGGFHRVHVGAVLIEFLLAGHLLGEQILLAVEIEVGDLQV